MNNSSKTMKIFLDTADTQAIKEGYNTGLVNGITTNPSLIMKSGRDPEEVYQELIDLGIPDISMEVVGNAASMALEGARLVKKFGKDQTTIKVPCTPDGLWVCKQLSKDLIKVNVTLIFSPAQAILAAKAGATYVSPFVGRVDDNSYGGLCLIKDIANIYAKQNWKQTEILAASIRNVRDVGRAFEYGANICTIPTGVFNKMYKHVLTDVGLAQFEKDWADVKVGFTD
jgi:transaldolase